MFGRVLQFQRGSQDLERVWRRVNGLEIFPWRAGKNLGNVAGRGEDYRETQVATLKLERVAFLWS